MSFCLPKEQTQKFIQALKEGVIDPGKLATMTSAERRVFFEKIVGKTDAMEVNALFEGKLLLKNQQAGMIAWAKKISGITEPVRRDIIARVEKMDKILDAGSEDVFLNDLASKKLGTEVTFEEAKTIADISKKILESEKALDPNSPIGSPSRIEYGANKVALENYINDLKLSNKPTGLKGFSEGFIKNPASAITKIGSDIAGLAKGMKSSLDNSAIFRQGWKTLFTNPGIWADNAVNSFKLIAKQLGNKVTDESVINGIKADIYSRPNSLNNNYRRMKLSIGEGEEAFPLSLPEKIPLFGRLYKASQTSYTGFLYRLRADIADSIIDIAKKNGVDFTDKLQIESMGKLVNSMTGRGNLGSLEKIGKQVNTVFFSPKNFKANLDFLSLHAFDDMSTFARKRAAINLLKVVTGTATILATARAIDEKSVELDPRSSDFGQIRIGNTRFDMSGGMRGLVTLAARIVRGSTKSTTTGKITELNSGKFGSNTLLDLLIEFTEGKLSPASSVIVDLLKGKNFEGEKPTFLGTIKDLVAPGVVTNSMELLDDPKAANFIMASIANGLGISTNTYGKKK